MDTRLLSELWAGRAPLIGMVHLAPLPGAPRRAGGMDVVLERAVADARALVDGGMDGVLVENYGDAPFHPDRVPAETVAGLAVAVAEVRRTVSVPVGVNVLRNDARAALGVAAATGAAFIRVNVHTGAMLSDQGWLTGRAHRTLRTREWLAPGVALLADVLVKHAVPPPGLDIRAAARDTWHRGLADGLIVTGPATGAAASVERVRAVREAVPEAVVWVGSGLSVDSARELASVAHGAIVGSAVQVAGAGTAVDPARARALVAAWRSGG